MASKPVHYEGRRPVFRDRAITTGEELPKCDAAVFAEGEIVAACAHGKQVAEDFCVAWRKSGRPGAVDWYFGSRRQVPNIATTGDVEEVRRAWREYLDARIAAGTLDQ